MAQQPVVRPRRWKGGSRTEPPLYEPNADDRWCNDTRRRVALKIGDCLIANQLTNRLVNTLTITDLERIAEVAAIEWTDARIERYVTEAEAESRPVDQSLLDRLEAKLTG